MRPCGLKNTAAPGENNHASRCPPFFIRFNNPIDTDTYADSMLTIEPALPGATINVYGNTSQIQGASKGQTTYTVTVSGDYPGYVSVRIWARMRA